MPILAAGEYISIELETDQAPFRHHGTMAMQDEEFIMIRGTVGDDIGRMVIVPKVKIKAIYKNA